MAKEKLPKLTESHIRELANDQSFERGKSYYRGEAILEPIRQGMLLRAECEGSEYEPYQVSATLNKAGVANASCTCPYDWGGICKHIVALLLTYVHEPQTFRVIPPLEEMLASRSREELIAIIGDMLNREPDLVSVVELAAATQQSKKVDRAAISRQARRALRHDSPRAIEKELRALLDGAARLAKSGDHLNAGAVYYAVFVEAVDCYDDLMHGMDEEGDIAIIVDDLAQGLGECLEKSNADNDTRREWLEALLSAELADIKLGGIDLAPSAYEAVLEYATDEDWEWIEQRLRAEISNSRDWARESLVNFLAEGQQRHGRASETAQLIREMGTPEQQTFLLVREGNIDEALRRMRKILATKPGLATEFADALVEAKANDAAVELMTGQAKSWRSTQWLADYYRKHGDPRQALEWQQKLFLESSSVEAFKALREIGRKLGAWEQVRANVLARLDSEKKIGPLIEIALHEGDVARALELLPRVKGGWQDYKSEVAKAAEKGHPQEAIALYREMGEQAIGRRSRGSYQQAAQYLKRAKALCERLNASSDWSAYIQSLRAQHANLPALQDELKKARL